MLVQLEKPNFESNNDNVFKALPTGEYNAMVTSTEVKNSKSGRPMLVVQYKLFGEKRCKGAMLDGRTEYQRVLLDTDFTGKILDNILYSLGFKTSNAIDVNKMVESNALIGRTCTLFLNESKYLKDGKELPTNEIKFLKPLQKIQPNQSYQPLQPKGFEAIDSDDIPF